MGLEPTRPYEHRHLKPACLPIPARSQIGLSRTLEYYTMFLLFVKGERGKFNPVKSQVLNANNFYIRFLLHLYKINNAP